MYASQVVPPGDVQSQALFSEFEKMVYSIVHGKRESPADAET